MKKSFYLIVFAPFFLIACEKPKPGFSLEGAAIRYETKNFEDAEVLAEANGQKFTKSQILDKSPVLIDLAAQAEEAKIGLAYLKIAERLNGAKPQGAVTIYRDAPKATLEQILARFGQAPVPGLTVTYEASDSADVLAQYQQIKITPDSIDVNHAVLQTLEQRRFQEIASQLNGQLARILISEEATRQNADLQTYVNNQVFGGRTPEVSDSEIYAYLKSIGFAKQELTEELKGRFKDSLVQRKQQGMMEEYTAKNILKGSPVYVAFTAPAAKLNLNENWKPVLGYKDAPVAMVAFSGATCPDCVAFISNVLAVMKKYDGHLKLNWIHNFNESDGMAQLMAETSLCVDRLAKGKSVAFMNAFAKDITRLDETAFYSWARDNGVSEKGLRACLLESTNKELVNQHVRYAKSVGIVANPTIWVEGRLLQGVVSRDDLEKLVNESIETKGSSQWKAFFRRIKARLGF